MRLRFLVLVIVACVAACAQTLSVRKLVEFMHSAAVQKNSDKDIAAYLATVKLTERLDDRTIEQLQSTGALGPRTLHALWSLRDRSKDLPEPKPAVPAEPKPVTPPPSSEDQGKILDTVRDYALAYTQNLPDFICTEVVKRAVAPRVPAGGDPAWRSQDTLTIKLSYFEQKEQYKLLLIDDRVTTKDYEAVGGAKAFGDFGSLMRGIFAPETEARFEWDGWATVRGQEAMVFSYKVEQSNSRYTIRYEDGRHIIPAYSGRVWVDKKSEVLRVTVKAENIPAAFPVKSALTTLDYDRQVISDQTFLLPVESVVIMASIDGMSSNDATFHNYHKYSADTNVTYK
jgi:hypothetical protein